MDNGSELIEEEDVKNQLRQQARTVYLKAIAAACVLTALVFVIPIR